jgi:hypothetical protein
MIAEVYDALREVEASEERSRAAAYAVAQFEDRLHRVESRLDVLTWMVGLNLTLTVAVLVKLFTG